MDKFTAILTPNPVLPNHVIKIDPTKCCSCNQCADICRCNVIMPHPTKGQPPLLVYPDECWHCAVCTENCPTGAIEFEHPINQKITWKRKTTGEMFRIGMKNPPAPYTKPACGDRRVRLEEYAILDMKVTEVERVARFVVRVKFETMGEAVPSYRIGAFCNVQISDVAYRGYSISNPHDGRTIELFIDIFGNGIGSQFFQALEVGREVEITAPLGRFCYKAATAPVLLVGSVTGISPIKAIVEEELVNLKSGRKMHMIFQVYAEEDMFLKAYFDEMAANYENFTYEFFFSSKIAETGVGIDKHIATLDLTKDAHCYICGSKPLIKSIERVLFDKGMSWLNIFYESFM